LAQCRLWIDFKLGPGTLKRELWEDFSDFKNRKFIQVFTSLCYQTAHSAPFQILHSKKGNQNDF